MNYTSLQIEYPLMLLLEVLVFSGFVP